jgi:hypothetical protein
VNLPSYIRRDGAADESRDGLDAPTVKGDEPGARRTTVSGEVEVDAGLGHHFKTFYGRNLRHS